MKKQVYFDVDGTIFNIHDRFYEAYSKSYNALRISHVDKEQFLINKRSGASCYPEHPLLEPFQVIFNQIFELPSYLRMDKLISGMDNVVNTCYRKYEVSFVSFRRNRDALISQILEHEMNGNSAITSEFRHLDYREKDTKAEMIKAIIPNPEGWIVGDTEYEILAGKKLGLTTIAVNWGDRSKEFLYKHNPDYIVDTPEQILEIIK